MTEEVGRGKTYKESKEVKRVNDQNSVNNALDSLRRASNENN